MNRNSIDAMEQFFKKRNEVLVYVLLIFTILTVYFQVRHHEFVVYDDRTYVTENSHVLKGVTSESLQWAFSFQEKDKTYWHPLTWLSHMLDVQVYGLDAGRHLMINVILHALNSFLLFYVFRCMTGDLLPSAFIAMLFALHPVNVESVAWVAARKNVLSTLFWMLTILSYVRYTRQPGAWRYAVMLVVFSLGLMAKPMLITLPFVLFLLDYWPLARMRFQETGGQDRGNEAIGRLILEKIPLFLLSVASIYISTFSLHQYGDLVPLGSVDIELRVSNALVSYIAYLGKMVVPMNLTCFYPFPVAVPLWKPIGALILLVGITAIAVRMLRNYPFFLIGWLWYIGTLLPVIGLMQAGLWPAMADRFAYIPFIGIYAVIAWGGAKIFETSKRSAIWFKFAAMVVLLVFLMVSHHQVRYWKNSVALFQHAIAVTKDNYLSYYAIGYAYEQLGNFEEAIRNYRSSLKINPDQIDVNYNLARVLASKGNIYDAIRHYQKVLQTDPKDSQAHNNLGNVYFRQGKLNKAIGHYLEAIHINPNYAKARNNLGAALIRKGMITAAIDQFRMALRIQPDDEQTRRLLEVAIAKLENRKKTSNSVTEH